MSDLLDEATRLLSGDMIYTEENIDRTLLALVERVQQAERRANFEAECAVSESIERDEARAKLDAVRTYIRQHDETSPTGREQWGADVLAILDGSSPDA